MAKGNCSVPKLKRRAEGSYRHPELGRIDRRATGWFHYRRGERKASGGPFKSFKAAQAHAADA